MNIRISEHFPFEIDGPFHLWKQGYNLLNYYSIYIYDSDLVWRMQLMIVKGKNSSCVYRVFLPFNAY